MVRNANNILVHCFPSKILSAFLLLQKITYYLQQKSETFLLFFCKNFYVYQNLMIKSWNSIIKKKHLYNTKLLIIIVLQTRFYLINKFTRYYLNSKKTVKKFIFTSLNIGAARKSTFSFADIHRRRFINYFLKACLIVQLWLLFKQFFVLKCMLIIFFIF